MSRRADRAAVLVLVLAGVWAGCGDRPRAEAPAGGRTYEVRGLVRQLPRPDRPQSELVIHHEAIPDFAGMNGQVVGMESMAMPFPVADPALLAGLEVGDRVAFTLRVDWDASPPVRVERLEKLPADTRLAFERPTETPPASGEDP